MAAAADLLRDGLLRRVVAQDLEESSLRAEANFLLAKIHLAQEDVDGARGRASGRPRRLGLESVRGPNAA